MIGLSVIPFSLWNQCGWAVIPIEARRPARPTAAPGLRCTAARVACAARTGRGMYCVAGACACLPSLSPPFPTHPHPHAHSQNSHAHPTCRLAGLYLLHAAGHRGDRRAGGWWLGRRRGGRNAARPGRGAAYSLRCRQLPGHQRPHLHPRPSALARPARPLAPRAAPARPGRRSRSRLA
jgi:hypothetical protein